jgi:hypothetical protein
MKIMSEVDKKIEENLPELKEMIIKQETMNIVIGVDFSS